jgi:hypothetical protein
LAGGSIAVLKEVLRLALFPTLLLATTYSQPRMVEFRGTPLSPGNEREMASAARRVAGGRYDRVVVTITDRVVAVRR